MKVYNYYNMESFMAEIAWLFKCNTLCKYKIQQSKHGIGWEDCDEDLFEIMEMFDMDYLFRIKPIEGD